LRTLRYQNSNKLAITIFRSCTCKHLWPTERKKRQYDSVTNWRGGISAHV